MMKVYAEYKDSGYDWTGKIPDHWNMIRLKFISPRISDKTSDTKDFDLQVALENIESHTGKLISNGSFDGIGNIFRKGDVLLNKLRPYLCKSIVAPCPGVAVGDLLVLRPKEDIDCRFLHYRILESKFMSVVDGSTYGAKMPRANWDFVGNLKIPTPPLSEQNVVADFLDLKTSKIDTLIEKKQRQIELLQELHTATINQAVTKGLNHDVPMKDSGIEWLGEVPANWVSRRIKVLGDVRYGLGQPPKECAGGIPLIRATNIERGRITIKDMLYIEPTDVPQGRNAFLSENEIIVVRSGAYTADSAIISAEYEGAVAGYDMVITPKKIFPKFLSFALLSHYVLKNQLYLNRMRAAQPHLNAYELSETIIISPPMVEKQKKISCYLDKATKRIDKTVDLAEREIVLLKEYRTALISEAVTGKIDVRREGA